jgi:hypothetical protein
MEFRRTATALMFGCNGRMMLGFHLLRRYRMGRPIRPQRIPSSHGASTGSLGSKE